MNRNYVYAFPSVHGTYNVVLYYKYRSRTDCSDIKIINFLGNFDIYKNVRGCYKYNKKYHCAEFWFECSKEFFEMLHTETMNRAFKRMGVELVFEYPFMEEFE